MHRKIKLKWNSSLFLEVIYFLGLILGFLMPTIPRLSEILTGFYAIIGLSFLFIFKGIKKREICELLLAIAVMLYSHSSEGVRYFLLLTTLITWSRFLNHRFINFIRVLVWFGLFASVMQIAGRVSRIEGFMYQSPPQFACIMMICMTYLLIYWMNKGRISKNRYDKRILVEIAICLILIFFTSTRSILAIALIECLYVFICQVVEKNKIKQKHKKYLLIVLLIVAVVVVVLMSDKAISLYNETTNRSASTLSDSDRTRAILIGYVISDITDNPIRILVGNGGGYVENLLHLRTGLSTYLPVHQDFVLILAEYGILGFALFYIVLLKKHKAWPVFLIMFIACSFHNIVLNTRAMILMVWVMCHIEYEGYEFIPGKNFFKRKMTNEITNTR